VSRCGSKSRDGCGAEIKWARAAGSGKWMPLDLPAEIWTQFDEGLVPEDAVGHERRFVLHGETARLEDVWVDGTGGYLVNTYSPHFATCPRSAEFRRQREAAGLRGPERRIGSGGRAR
jgi:hypothetical protein